MVSMGRSPGELLIDAASEFTSDGFANFVQMHDIKVTTISAEAHFQNGKAERHGAVLQDMLSKFELEHDLNNYKEVQQALWYCTQAKNACGLRKGYAPEVLVLGKQTRLPGSVVDGINLPAHLLADSDCALGIKFKQQLAFRETARRAYHSADNDAALRRSVLRRANPHRGSYHPGEWVMVWKQGQLDGSHESHNSRKSSYHLGHHVVKIIPLCSRTCSTSDCLRSPNNCAYTR